MKVHILCNLGTNDFPDMPLEEGIHTVPDSFGAKLVKQRLAIEIVEQTPEPAVELELTKPVDKFEKMRAQNEFPKTTQTTKPASPANKSK